MSVYGRLVKTYGRGCAIAPSEYEGDPYTPSSNMGGVQLILGRVAYNPRQVLPWPEVSEFIPENSSWVSGMSGHSHSRNIVSIVRSSAHPQRFGTLPAQYLVSVLVTDPTLSGFSSRYGSPGNQGQIRSAKDVCSPALDRHQVSVRDYKLAVQD